jgi:phage replication-related protein YjqB (UPF0714/DUF867 family)
VPDTYANYADLAAHEVEGTDYRVRQRTPTGSAMLHLAIHGGGIEPGSAECADYCAAQQDRQFYTFEGIKSSGNSVLHLTSTHFDEPRALAQTATAAYTISWHGADGSTPQVYMGGADTVLRDRIAAAITQAGFTVADTPTELDGDDPASINQKNRRLAGVQIEMTLALRQSFFPDGDTGRTNRDDPGARTTQFFKFCGAVLSALTGIDPLPDAGNWLDYTTQSTEIDTATWVTDSNATLARASGGVGAGEVQQRHCIAVTAPAAGDSSIRTRYQVPVTPGSYARLDAAAYTPAADIPVVATARWYAANGTTLIGTTTATVTPPGKRWTYCHDIGAVPAGAALATYALAWTAPTAGSTAYFDRAILGTPQDADDPSPGVPWRRIRLGYPRLGRRRTDISFATGVNITSAVPVSYSADDYAQVVVATGAGEGRAQYRAIDAVRDGRLRMEHVLELPNVRGNDVLARRARTERTWRQRMGSIASITVIDHPAAPFGSWQLGDDVPVSVHDQWTDYDGWMRITGWRAQPDGEDGERFVLSLARADSYTYGA